MTREEAKQTLMLYRPEVPDTEDTALQEALALAEEDADLKAWLESHLVAQQSLRQKFQSLSAPEDLPSQILAAFHTIRPPLWKRPSALWLAAALFLLLGFVAKLWVFAPPGSDRFQNFQSRMVSSVLREYRMDIVTDQAIAVREYMRAHKAPATFEVPPGLQQLSLTGGGVLRWRDHPVSMLCYDRGTNQMIFLFVMSRQAPRDAPASTPHVEAINKLATASWTKGDWTYFMAAEWSPGFPENYLPDPER